MYLYLNWHFPHEPVNLVRDQNCKKKCKTNQQPNNGIMIFSALSGAVPIFLLRKFSVTVNYTSLFE